MKINIIKLWEKEEYIYPFAGEFVPNIVTYLHEDDEARPAILVVPGGGYASVCPYEGEMVAKHFYHAGYQAFVLTYTTNTFQLEPLKKQPLKDISRAVRYIRKYSADLYVNEKQIICCGFSAGAHLTGSLAVHYQDKELASEPYVEVSNRPDAVVLCYPVITSGEKAHRESFELLLGKEASEEELRWASLEKQVTEDTPPAFLWQTFTDELVPVDNSILYTRACREKGVPCELHLFMEGKHGMSLANKDYATNNFGEHCFYTMMQQWTTLRTLDKEKTEVVPEFLKECTRAESLNAFIPKWIEAIMNIMQLEENKEDPSAMQWTNLVLTWADKIFAKQK